MTTLLNAQGDRIADPLMELEAESASSFLDWDSFLALPKETLGIALRIPNTLDVANLVTHFSRLSLVTLNFPAFADGRAYSQATRLRHLGFKGILRASGAAVIPDQLLMMRRCGIDQFELFAAQHEDTAAKRLKQACVQAYQPDSICSYTVPRQR